MKKNVTATSVTKKSIKFDRIAPRNGGSALYREIMYGCDPELFISKDGVVMGSEKVIPEDGINISGKIIRDGIQIELNPDASHCRKLLASSIQSQLIRIKEAADSVGGDVDMRVTVPITESEMDSLSPHSKMFGCNGSFNVYGDNSGVSTIDGSKYMSRSAGGHIHLGVVNKGSEVGNRLTEVLRSPERLVPVLDLIVANTMVMVDRDEGNKKRRTTYGRAGEYRTPAHGIEYRTLSNFWLKNYTLFSIVFGLTKQAIEIVYASDEKNDYAAHLMSLVNIEDVKNAINNNDAVLAKKNFDKIKSFVCSISHNDPYEPNVISDVTIKGLEKFLASPESYWTQETDEQKDVAGKWLRTYGGYSSSEGAERFLIRVSKD